MIILFFLYHKYETIKFDDHVQAWEITLTSYLFFCTSSNNFPSFQNPCTSSPNYKGTIYIMFKS